MARAPRKIVRIDEDKCNGCGLCVPQCAEGAIRIIDGKAKLVSEVYCDGLGACLGHCPLDAISIEERPAEAFDEQAVARHVAPSPTPSPAPPSGGCPGAALRSLKPQATGSDETESGDAAPSMLGQWPVQLALVPPNAPFLVGADLVICADCVPLAVADFHRRYLKGRAVVVGCPKLDDLPSYRNKLVDMFDAAKPRRVTVLRMEVPCCGGIAAAASEAREAAIPDTPLETHVISIDGSITVSK